MDDAVTGGIDELIENVRELTRVRCWRDARGLAWKLGIELHRCERAGATLNGLTIEYDRSADSQEAQRLIACEVARWALLQWGLRAPEHVVRYVAEQLVEHEPPEQEELAQDSVERVDVLSLATLA
jgi:hypothetical protein